MPLIVLYTLMPLSSVYLCCKICSVLSCIIAWILQNTIIIVLRRVQLEESNQVIWQQAWEHGEPQQEVQHQLHGGNVFFHPLDGARGEPTLQIG